MSGAPLEIDKPAVVELDLYCLRCGYNLRGLAGDPVRCPECFFANPVGDAMPPAGMISQQLRKLETSPTFCFVGLVGLVGALTIAIVSAMTGTLGDGSPGLVCLGVPSLAFFSLGLARFRATCGNNPAWRAALLRYQLCASAMFASLLIPIAGAIAAHATVSRLEQYRSIGESLPDVASAVTAALLLIPTWMGCVRPLYEAACAVIHPLQRELAISMVRDYTRRRMIAGGGFGLLDRFSELT
ncbi:MAG: hypothetical protein CHACPFDD_02761 [Phycisphaerae bacterium]|nr:hypothetical protein [Phycisphaerae bacterium]